MFVRGLRGDWSGGIRFTHDLLKDLILLCLARHVLCVESNASHHLQQVRMHLHAHVEPADPHSMPVLILHEGDGQDTGVLLLLDEPALYAGAVSLSPPPHALVDGRLTHEGSQPVPQVMVVLTFIATSSGRRFHPQAMRLRPQPLPAIVGVGLDEESCGLLLHLQRSLLHLQIKFVHHDQHPFRLKCASSVENQTEQTILQQNSVQICVLVVICIYMWNLQSLLDLNIFLAHEENICMQPQFLLLIASSLYEGLEDMLFILRPFFLQLLL
mmetsp:Transcript_44399/g.140106  ORF Transcript_44399/g.140106 Transcript_44399/m.140106 type:complete len:270 (+) Transcript_44399:2198-3007(+)